MGASITENRASTVKSDRIFYGICFAFFILFLVRAWMSGNNDFHAYYSAGTRALAGENPYQIEQWPFRYLPLIAFFFTPFALLPEKLSSIVFFLSNYAAVIFIYWEIRKKIGDLGTFLIAALFFRFHNHDFGNAQINPWLICLFFYWWRTRKENLTFSSLAFSVFASFKITPLAFGLPLLLLGKWKELSWMMLWTVTLNFLPIFFYHDGPFVFQSWWEQARGIQYPAVMLPNVQSLQSALWWQLEGVLAPARFAILSHGLQLALFFVVFFMAPRGEKLERRREDWIFVSTLAVTVLIAQLAWKHSYLQFIPLVFLWFREDPKFTQIRTRILYGISLLGMVILPSAAGVRDRVWADHLYLMVWSGLIVILLGLKYSQSRSGEHNYPLPLSEQG